MTEPTNQPTSQPRQGMTPEELKLLAAYQDATGALLCFDTSQGFAFKDEVYQWVADGCPNALPDDGREIEAEA